MRWNCKTGIDLEMPFSWCIIRWCLPTWNKTIHSIPRFDCPWCSIGVVLLALCSYHFRFLPNDACSVWVLYLLLVDRIRDLLLLLQFSYGQLHCNLFGVQFNVSQTHFYDLSVPISHVLSAFPILSLRESISSVMVLMGGVRLHLNFERNWEYYATVSERTNTDSERSWPRLFK